MPRRPRVWRWILKLVLRRRNGLKSFEQEVQARGGILGRAQARPRTVAIEKIVGSVGRAQSLRSDFFNRYGRAMTSRYCRIGEAMQRGAPLPPVDLYKLKRDDVPADGPPSEYYVLDGHHRVAMARKLGQAYLDASIVEYTVAGPDDIDAGNSQREDDPGPDTDREIPEAPGHVDATQDDDSSQEC